MFRDHLLRGVSAGALALLCVSNGPGASALAQEALPAIDIDAAAAGGGNGAPPPPSAPVNAPAPSTWSPTLPDGEPAFVQRWQLPNTVSSVTRQDIEEKVNIIDTEDALKYTPSLFRAQTQQRRQRRPCWQTRTWGVNSSARSARLRRRSAADGACRQRQQHRRAALGPRFARGNRPRSTCSTARSRRNIPGNCAWRRRADHDAHAGEAGDHRQGNRVALQDFSPLGHGEHVPHQCPRASRSATRSTTSRGSSRAIGTTRHDAAAHLCAGVVGNGRQRVARRIYTAIPARISARRNSASPRPCSARPAISLSDLCQRQGETRLRLSRRRFARPIRWASTPTTAIRRPAII